MTVSRLKARLSERRGERQRLWNTEPFPGREESSFWTQAALQIQGGEKKVMFRQYRRRGEEVTKEKDKKRAGPADAS